MFMKRFPSTAALAAILLLAACGDDNLAAGSAAPATVAVTAAAATTSTLPLPTHIVSLSPSATETLFAIGAGDQVLAVDDQSNYPPEALQKPHDLSGFEPNVEAIAALKPDLVVMADDFNELIPQLEKVGLKVWSGPAAKSFDDVYSQIEQLGAITGHVADAAQLVLKMQTDIDAAVKAAPPAAAGKLYYHELSADFYSANSNTFIGQVYGLFGLKNIADTSEGDSDYPQLSAEFIISQSPDFIFLADTKCCAESPETVAARAGWGTIAAVATGNVVAMDDDTASRWGPRIVDYIKAVGNSLAKAPVGG
jgi:iron complex transport system substrate-binding protein